MTQEPQFSGTFAPVEDKATSSVPGVYILQHNTSSMFYVGSTSNLYQRAASHRSKLKCGRHEVPEIQKAYELSPGITIVALPTKNVEEARSLEQVLLDQNRADSRCLNKASDAYTPRKGMAPSNKGKSPSEETRKKISEANQGRTFTPEQRENMSLSRTGKKRSSEFCQRQSERMKGKPINEGAQRAAEAYRKEQSKAVVVNGEMFPSVLAAAQHFGVDRSTVKYRAQSASPAFNNWSYAKDD